MESTTDGDMRRTTLSKFDPKSRSTIGFNSKRGTQVENMYLTSFYMTKREGGSSERKIIDLGSIPERNIATHQNNRYMSKRVAEPVDGYSNLTYAVN
jgi:hypothetical protein